MCPEKETGWAHMYLASPVAEGSQWKHADKRLGNGSPAPL
jgi:hypothetical protein